MGRARKGTGQGGRGRGSRASGDQGPEGNAKGDGQHYRGGNAQPGGAAAERPGPGEAVYGGIDHIHVPAGQRRAGR